MRSGIGSGRFGHGAGRSLAALCTILSVLLAACGSSGSAAKSTTTSTSSAPAAPAAASAPAPTHLTVLELSPAPNPLLWYWTLAKDVGAFKKYNLDVTIRHSGGGGPQKIQALLGGQADVVTTDIISLSAAVRKGAPVVGIFVPTPYFTQDLVANDTITSVKQLAGKAFGVPSMGGAGRFLTIDVLQHAGVAHAITGVHWAVSANEAARMELMNANRTQAVMLPPSEAALVGPNGKYKHGHTLIPNTATITGPFPNFVLATTPTIAKQKAKALTKLMEAMMYAMRVVTNSPSKFGAAGVAMTNGGGGYTKALLTKVDQQIAPSGYWGENGGINFSSLDHLVQLYYRVTGLKPNHYLSSGKQLVDTQFVAAALQKVGLDKSAKDQPDWNWKK